MRRRQFVLDLGSGNNRPESLFEGYRLPYGTLPVFMGASYPLKRPFFSKETNLCRLDFKGDDAFRTLKIAVPVPIFIATRIAMETMVSRIRKTLTVRERAAMFEHTTKVATEARDEEAREREEKTARLRALRLAAGLQSSK